MRIEDQIDISKLDWEYIWQKNYQKDRKKGKDWNTVSKDFGKWLENDDYPDVLISSMRISPNDTVLDLGAAEGTISLKLAEKAKSVTALDRAEKMLEELDKKCMEQGITNVETVQMDIEDISLENTKKHDIILASRSSTISRKGWSFSTSLQTNMSTSLYSDPQHMSIERKKHRLLERNTLPVLTISLQHSF